MRTTPGFTMDSKMFSLKFMSASQQGQLSHLLEYQTDWKEVMQILLTSLETCPTNKTKVEKMASDKLEEWTLTLLNQQYGGHELELKIGVIISDSLDSFKSLKLVFKSRRIETVLLFNVRRKKVMNTLKTFAAEVVSCRLSQAEDVYSLEIPRGLFLDIDTAYNDSWRARYVDTTHKKEKIID